MNPTTQSRPPARFWSTVAMLTLGMGMAVTVSWTIFFRSLDSYGPELAAMVRPERLAVYATQFALIFPFTFVFARWRLRGVPATSLAATAVTAWLMEGVVLTIIGAPLVANELDPEIAWYYWLSATAGPVQPLVAFIGLWLGARSVRAR